MVATRREAYVHLAVACAASLHAVAPHVPITLFTNVRGIPPELTPDFARIVELEAPTRTRFDWADGLMDKLRGLRASPYARTFFIDADTLVRSAEIASAFTLLEHHDILITECAEDASYSRRLLRGPLYSTGILGFRRSPKVSRLFGAWTDFALECLAAVRDERTAELPAMHGLTLDEQTFLALTDQYTLWRFLAPGRNPFELDVRVLEERWNFRGDGQRAAPADLIVDHRMVVKEGRTTFSA